MSRKVLLLILIIAALVNLVGAFGPELGFDALWYHLTLPKLYILAGKIYHVPGGLLYYSEMPRLGEMLYLPLLKYIGDLGPHLLSWTAGIGATILVYKLTRKLGLSSFLSLLSSLVFYVTPLVGWQSGSSYVDLLRTFFEALALYLVLSKKSLLAGLAIGLAISTKTLALGSVLPLLVILYLITKNFRSCILFLVSCILVSLPWFLSAYLNTGYPFYPIGAGILDATHQLNFDVWNLPKLLSDFWRLWLSPEDPISPIYLITLPFLAVSLPKLKKFVVLLLYCFISFIVWYVIPHTGGGRFILPYLPAWAVLVAAVAGQKRILIFAIILVALINLSYRVLANAQLLPYLLGRETKTAYLCRHLDLTITYVNCNGFSPKGLVYVKGIHNLYYIDFPFVHQSWYRGEKYSHVLQ